MTKLPIATLVDAWLDDGHTREMWSKGSADFDASMTNTLHILNKEILGGVVQQAQAGNVDAICWLEERRFIKPLSATRPKLNALAVKPEE